MLKDIYPLKLYLKKKPNIVMISLSILINISTWVWLFWFIRPQDDQIFLHYNILFGVDYVGEWWKIVYAPTSGLVIFLVNIILGWIFFSKDKFASYLLNAISVFCQVLILMAASVIVFLNV